MSRNYDELQVVDDLNHNHKNIVIPKGRKEIYLIIENQYGTMGHGTKGKIDFLVHHCNYDLIHVQKYTDIKKISKD